MDCGNPATNVTNAMQTFSSGSIPSATTYLFAHILKCLVGYRWTDGSPTKTITCQADGRWSAVPPCTGRQFHNTHCEILNIYKLRLDNEDRELN